MSDAFRELLTLDTSRPGWLERYGQVLEGRMHPQSREIVLEDSKYIADLAVLPAGDVRWPSSRERTGVVVGAVQSGKTASMIGMAARALDSTANVIVILGGRQTALWKQTLERVRAQLLSGPAGHACLLRPAYSDSGAAITPRTAYTLVRRLAVKELRRGRPLVFVAMKETHHLESLGHVLKENIYPAAAELGVMVNLLVIDDEADDASVADDRQQWSPGELTEFKQIPRRVIELWESRRSPGETCAEHVYATYVAYTATPQANFLQNSENPLAPRDFVAALRTPGREGMRFPRSLTYKVPGIRNWYTGAELFYDLLGDFLCEEVGQGSEAEPEGGSAKAQNGPTTDGEDLDEAEIALLKDSVRAYLVAAAIRQIRSGRIGPATAAHMSFSSMDDAKRHITPVSSMLVHPASDTESHFRARDLIRDWWSGPGGSLEGVLDDLRLNEDLWMAWSEKYKASAAALRDKLAGDGVDDLAVPAWDEVRQVIREEVVPATQIQVVNSRPDADERPDFAPWSDADGVWHAPSNHSTIFISGNVMSRGLTLEGLLTTVFTRATQNPLADTQMQMQRWFGYRGEYLDLCRVFLTPVQRELFEQYAAADEALRTQVLAAMDLDNKALPDFTVLQGKDFQATGKVASLVPRPLIPGQLPVIRHLNRPGQDQRNQRVVADLFLADEHRHLDPRGLLLSRELDLEEAAALLDSLSYSRLGREASEANRWSQMEQLLHLDARADRGLCPLYRAPVSPEDGIPVGARSPYSLAGYLRLWRAALDRDVPGLLASGVPARRWNLIERSTRYQQSPAFRIGLRFGRGEPVTRGPLAELGVVLGAPMRSMDRNVTSNGDLDADWGSRGFHGADGYQGDDVFDGLLLRERIERSDDGSREPGQPGLLLFLPVNRGGGEVTLAVAASIPTGGPDYVEAVNSRLLRRLK